MPAELSAYLAVVEESARKQNVIIYVMDDGEGRYWSTIYGGLIDREAKHWSVHPSGTVVVHHPGR